MLTIPGRVASADGLRGDDRALVHDLVKAWHDHYDRNMKRHCYYIMHNQLVDLGISIPPKLRNLDAACGWAQKTVDVMVEHSIFDGFTVGDEQAQSELDVISHRNRMKTKYRKATTSALEQSFNLYFVSKDDNDHAHVSAYPAHACGVLWDDANDCIKAALFVVDTKKNKATGELLPTWVNVVTPEYLIRIKCDSGRWYVDEYEPHGLKHLPVFLAAYNSTLERPFGQSRITREIMGYIDSAVRANINEEIASAFAATAQKYLLGTDGDPFEGVDRWQAFIGAIFNIDATADGTIPQFGQLPQPSMQPLTDHFRNLCAKMSAATGIHVSQFGLVHDQPASAEAIYAENSPLIRKVKAWHSDVSETLVDVAIASLATERDTTFDEIESLGLEIMPRFMNPAMPTLAQMTDANVKIASVVPAFANTPTFWRSNGYSDEEVATILRELRREQAVNAVSALVSTPIEPAPETAATSQGPDSLLEG